VPFVVLDDAVEMLQSDASPVNGLFVPGWARRLLGPRAGLNRDHGRANSGA
jgi:hypothetical protein